jgi:hypothetical protein
MISVSTGADLLIAVERHAIHAGPNNTDRHEAGESVTV